MKLSQDGKALYNPFDTGSDKANDYDAWAALMDAQEVEQADEIFKKHHHGISYAERNGE